MAGDPPPDLPLVPLISLGALDSPRTARPDALAAFEPQEPRLFALAWLITGGHDGAASRVLAESRGQFASSWTGATDPMTYALTLLVPRACRAARGVNAPVTGEELLDQLLAVHGRARAALALHVACGLDDAAVGQLLGVDRHDAASLQRHALGACRFTGVPEVVRATFDEQVARVIAQGVPAATRPRVRRTPILIATLAVGALVAGLVTWRVARDDATFTAADPTVTHYVALAATTGWRRDSVDVATVDYGTAPRLYLRTAADGLLTARLVVVPREGRATDQSSGSTSLTQIGDHQIAIDGPEGSASSPLASTQVTSAQVTAPCGSAQMISFGVSRDALVAAGATMRCDPDGSRRVVPPGGLHERSFPDAGRVFITTANYRNPDGAFLFLRAEPALVEPEILSTGGAHLVRRDGTRYIVSRSDVIGRNPLFTVRWLLGDATVTLSVFGALDEDAVITLAAQVAAVDEARFRADPPTTTR